MDMRTWNAILRTVRLTVVIAHDAPLRTESITTFLEKMRPKSCRRVAPAQLRKQLCAMQAQTFSPSTMSDNNRDGDDPSNRQDRETLDLLTRLLLLQSTTSDQQNRDPTRAANLALLRQLEMAAGLSSEGASRTSQNPLGGSLPASLQPLQAQLLLDSLLRSGAPTLPLSTQTVSPPNAAMALGLPAATIHSLLNACLPQKQAQQPLDMGLQQLALLVRQYQNAAAQLSQPPPPPNVNPTALFAALNALAALQPAQLSNPPALALMPPAFAALPGLGVVPPVLATLGLGGMTAMTTLTQHPLASSGSVAESQVGGERPSSTGSEPSSKSRREKKQGIKNEAFPLKLYRLLKDSEEAGKDDIVSFTHTGNAFKIHHQQRFANEILPDYFRHKRFDSFKRQLSMYGFVRIPVGPEEGAFEHRLFKRERLDLVHQMRRVAVEQSAATSEASGATGIPPASQAGGFGAAKSDSHAPANGLPGSSSTVSGSDSLKPPPSGA
jgi:HSF-type DNA-binding